VKLIEKTSISVALMIIFPIGPSNADKNIAPNYIEILESDS
jgi:hypothetical protein